MEFSFDYFISHLVQDQKEHVLPLVEALEASGKKVFFSGRDLGMGQDLTSSINDALVKSHSFILVYTPNLYREMNGSYVQQEFTAFNALAGLERKITVVVREIPIDKAIKKHPLYITRFSFSEKKSISEIIASLLSSNRSLTPTLKAIPNLKVNHNFNVLLLPFDELFSSASSRINVNALVENNIRDLGYQEQMNILIEKEDKGIKNLSTAALQEFAKRKNIDLVIYGTFYEQAGQIRMGLRYLLTFGNEGMHAGKLDNHTGRVLKKESIFSGSFELFDIHSFLYWVLAIRAYWMGDFRSSLGFLAKIEKPEDVPLDELNFKKGVCQMALGAYNEAINSFQKLGPEHHLYEQSQVNLGNLFLFLEKWDLAQNAYRQIPSYSLLYPSAKNNLDVLSLAMGKPGKLSIQAPPTGSGNAKIDPISRYNQMKNKGDQTSMPVLMKWKEVQNNPVYLHQYRNSPFQSSESFLQTFEEDALPILVLDHCYFPFPPLQTDQKLDSWGIAVESKTGEMLINPLQTSGKHIIISREDLFESKVAHTQQNSTTVSRILYKINQEKALGQKICKLSFCLIPIIPFWEKMNLISLEMPIGPQARKSGLRKFIMEEYSSYTSGIHIDFILQKIL
ncbi:MAG: toll/interleukin-1 receptor domain-containing protein [Bacteroidia bacterium]|nr:toll/interleukin-1 receptor domain-containing protein [Bacteroidia bacterium]